MDGPDHLMPPTGDLADVVSCVGMIRELIGEIRISDENVLAQTNVGKAMEICNQVMNNFGAAL